jgi:hypothetical protein
MTRHDASQEPSVQRTHNIGGSVLPSSDPSILEPLRGRHGTFRVRPMPELDTYGLVYNETTVLAMHSNGYACHSLAKRILTVWEGEMDISYAMAQFDHVMRCGGLGLQRSAIEYYARGLRHD